MKLRNGISLVLAMWSVCGAVVPQGPYTAEFQTARGTIRIRNYSNIKVDEQGNTEFLGVGNPVVVEDTGTGVTLIGKSMHCILSQNAKREYTLESATLTDGAQVSIDSSIAANTKAELARKQNLPVPTPSKVTSRTHIESDTIAYSLKGEEGVLTFPKPLDYSDTSEGSVTRTRATEKIEVPFTQLTRVSGSQGRFTLNVPADPKADIEPRTGHLDGPVKFSVARTENPPPLPNAAAVPEATTIDGLGDAFDGDFTGSGDPTLTLTGNVTVNGSGRGFNGKVAGTKAVLTLERTTRQPKGYDFSGSPATTTVRNAKVGGR